MSAAPAARHARSDEVLARLGQVLVPVDFSSHSADALSVACSIAAARGLAGSERQHRRVQADQTETVQAVEHEQEDERRGERDWGFEIER